MGSLSINYLLSAEDQSPFEVDFPIEVIAQAQMASFRLRCGLPAKWLSSYGHRVGICAPPKETESFDHLIVLKPPISASIHNLWFDFIQLWQGKGAKIWFDVSDAPFTSESRRAFAQKVAPSCTGFIANSEETAKALASVFKVPIFIIPDPVEFSPRSPSIRPFALRRLLWFGHPTNLSSLLPWVEELRTYPEIRELVILSDATVSKSYLEKNIPLGLQGLPFSVRIFEWHPETLSRIAPSIDVCLIPAGDSESKRGVSDNRLITSITLGMLTIASPVASYTKWEPGCVIASSFSEGINRLSSCSEQLISQMPITQDQIQSQRSIESISKKLCSVLNGSESAFNRNANLNQKRTDSDSELNIRLRHKFFDAVKAQVNGDIEIAIHGYNEVLKSDPNHSHSYHNLAIILLSQGKLQSSLDHASKSIQINPYAAEFWCTLSSITERCGDLVKAHKYLKQALKIDPANKVGLINISALLLRLNQPQESLAFAKKLLGLDPSSRAGLLNRAEAYSRLNQPNSAKDDLELAFKSTPDDPALRFSLGTVHLKLGHYDVGWDLYESRWQLGQASPRKLQAPLWDGHASLDGKRILIYAEQGFGDTLQFCRYVKLLSEIYSTHVVLMVPRTLLRLMDSLQGVESAIPLDQPTGHIDFVAPLLTLPRYLQRSSHDIYHPNAYLNVKDKDRLAWSLRVNQHCPSDKLKVGICWAGSSRTHHKTSHEIDRRRSLRIEQITPLSKFEELCFVSLQKHASSEVEPGSLSSGNTPWLIDLMEQCQDFYDTASLISNLDHVISVDTSIAHLSGALGIPTTIYHRIDSCWRWGHADFKPLWYENSHHITDLAEFDITKVRPNPHYAAISL